MTEPSVVVVSDAGGVLKLIKSLEPNMTEFTLSRACIRDATGWRYYRVRTLINKPYRLDSRTDPAGPNGGGQRERFRLGDVMARCRAKCAFDENSMTPKLIAADAAYRKDGDK
jgi:hypothetical protein